MRRTSHGGSRMGWLHSLPRVKPWDPSRLRTATRVIVCPLVVWMIVRCARLSLVSCGMRVQQSQAPASHVRPACVRTGRELTVACVRARMSGEGQDGDWRLARARGSVALAGWSSSCSRADTSDLPAQQPCGRTHEGGRRVPTTTSEHILYHAYCRKNLKLPFFQLVWGSHRFLAKGIRKPCRKHMSHEHSGGAEANARDNSVVSTLFVTYFSSLFSLLS